MSDITEPQKVEASRLKLSSTIEELLDMTAEQLASLTDEQLEAYLAPSFEVCPPISQLAGVVAIAEDEPRTHRLTPATVTGRKMVDAIKAERSKPKKQTPQELMAALTKELFNT